jgi:holo-[acyl-carrier protein] synthase
MTNFMEQNQMFPNIEIGTDIIETIRFRKKPIDQNQSFYELIFSKLEIEHCLNFSDPYPHFAGVFAAKESIVKSYVKPLTMKQIEIFWNVSGKPSVLIKSENHNSIKISISHSSLFAIAVAFSFYDQN